MTIIVVDKILKRYYDILIRSLNSTSLEAAHVRIHQWLWSAERPVA